MNLWGLDAARGPFCIVSEENQEVEIELYELRFAEKSYANVQSRCKIKREAGMILITAHATQTLSSGMRATNGLLSLAWPFLYTKRSLALKQRARFWIGCFEHRSELSWTPRLELCRATIQIKGPVSGSHVGPLSA